MSDNMEKLGAAFKAMPPRELLRASQLMREAYVQSIANTETQLDPARLRKLDADIRDLEERINRGE